MRWVHSTSEGWPLIVEPLVVEPFVVIWPLLSLKITRIITIIGVKVIIIKLSGIWIVEIPVWRCLVRLHIVITWIIIIRCERLVIYTIIILSIKIALLLIMFIRSPRRLLSVLIILFLFEITRLRIITKFLCSLKYV